jgi:transposase-like protein
MGKAITDGERDRMLSLLREGFSHCEVARRTGRSQSTVSALAKEYGIQPVNLMPRVQQAARDYNKVERRNLLNLAFDKAGDLLERRDITARDFKDVVTAVAIAIDKRRLEDGEAGEISEQRTGSSSSGRLDLNKEFSKLDREIAEEMKRKEP